jgi:hypothetical protein
MKNNQMWQKIIPREKEKPTPYCMKQVKAEKKQDQ